MNRRSLLALAPAAVLPSPSTSTGRLQPLPDASSPDHPDAALFAACARCVADHDAIEAMPEGQPDEVWDTLGDQWADAIEAVIDMRARTRIGCKAKARILVLYMDREPVSRADQERRFAWRLAHDVLLGAMA